MTNNEQIQELLNDKELNDCLEKMREEVSLVLAKYGLEPSRFVNFEAK